MTAPDKLLEVNVVAMRLNVSAATVYRMIASGRIKALNTGNKKAYRVPESEVNRVLAPTDAVLA